MNLQEATIKALTEQQIKSNYDEVLELLDVMPDSPFDESEEDVIRDIMANYPNKSSQEIADIYNEYCETGVY